MRLAAGPGRATAGRVARLPPEAWFPAGEPELHARVVTLPNGLRVRVVETGPVNGAPVVLLHGWACSAYSYRYQLPALAAAGFRALAVDLKGHGLTDKPLEPEAYSRPAMTAFAEGVADALGLDRFALVGHSLGGGIATRFALEHPGRVSRLAALSAVGFGRVPFVPLVRALPSVAVEPLLPYLMPRWLYRLVLWGVTGSLQQYSEADVAQYWAATQFPEFPVVLWRLTREYGWAELEPAEREQLRMPLLSIYGSGDRVVRSGGQRSATGAAAQLAGVGGEVEAHVIEGAGHAAHEEAPGEVTRLLLDFLAPWGAS